MWWSVTALLQFSNCADSISHLLPGFPHEITVASVFLISLGFSTVTLCKFSIVFNVHTYALAHCEGKLVFVVVLQAWGEPVAAHKYLSALEQDSAPLYCLVHKGSDIEVGSPAALRTSRLGNPGVPWRANLRLYILAVLVQADSSLMPFGSVPFGSFVNRSREFQQLYKRTAAQESTRFLAHLRVLAPVFTRRCRQVCAGAAAQHLQQKSLAVSLSPAQSGW